MKLKYNIIKSFVNAEDICLLYDIDIEDKKIFTCGWYKVSQGKISKLFRKKIIPIE